MAVIRSTHAGAIARDALALDLGDLRQRADGIIEAAKEHAGDIIAQARRECESLKASAGEVGHAEGYAAGRDAGFRAGFDEGRTQTIAAVRADLDALTASWRAAIDAFQRDRDTLFYDAENELIELAVRIAERVVHRAIDITPEVVVDQVRDTLRFLRRASSLIVSVHPEDKTLLSDALPDIVSSIATGPDIAIAEDASLARGGCRIDSPGGGSVDCSIATQIARIAEMLLPRSMHHSDHPSQTGDAPS